MTTTGTATATTPPPIAARIHELRSRRAADMLAEIELFASVTPRQRTDIARQLNLDATTVTRWNRLGKLLFGPLPKTRKRRRNIRARERLITLLHHGECSLELAATAAQHGTTPARALRLVDLTLEHGFGVSGLLTMLRTDPPEGFRSTKRKQRRPSRRRPACPSCGRSSQQSTSSANPSSSSTSSSSTSSSSSDSRSTSTADANTEEVDDTGVSVPAGAAPGVYVQRRGRTTSTLVVTLNNTEFAQALAAIDSCARRLWVDKRLPEGNRPTQRLAALLALIDGPHQRLSQSTSLLISITTDQLEAAARAEAAQKEEAATRATAEAREDEEAGGGEDDAGVGYGTNYGVVLPAIPLAARTYLSIHDPVSFEPIGLAATRLATAGQRVALATKQAVCAYPGCARPIAECQVHHITPVERGGATELGNLVALCSHHHGLVSDDANIVYDADGDALWRAAGSRDATNRYFQRRSAKATMRARARAQARAEAEAEADAETGAAE